MLIPSKPWLFCRPVTGLAVTGTGWPAAGLLELQSKTSFRVGLTDAATGSAPTNCPSAAKR